MTIETKRNADQLLLTIAGRLDTTTAPALEKELDASLDGVRALEMDFSALEYLSSAGLRVLLAAQKRMNEQGEMVLRHVNDSIQEIFDITGFSDILTILP